MVKGSAGAYFLLCPAYHGRCAGLHTFRQSAYDIAFGDRKDTQLSDSRQSDHHGRTSGRISVSESRLPAGISILRDDSLFGNCRHGPFLFRTGPDRVFSEKVSPERDIQDCGDACCGGPVAIVPQNRGIPGRQSPVISGNMHGVCCLHGSCRLGGRSRQGGTDRDKKDAQRQIEISLKNR